MALDAFLIGIDSAAQGDWLGNRGSLGYCIATGPGNSLTIVSGSIATAVGGHPQSGGTPAYSTPGAETERRALLLPDGSARTTWAWRDDRSGDFNYRYQCSATPGWVVASVYLCNFIADPAPGGVRLTPLSTVPYVYQWDLPGDYQQGVWLRFAVNSTASWRLVIPNKASSSGAFFDPYPAHSSGLNQHFVGHGVF